MDPLLQTLVVVAIVTLIIICVAVVMLTMKGVRTLDDGHRVLSRLDRMTEPVEGGIKRAAGLLDGLVTAAQAGISRLSKQLKVEKRKTKR